MIEKRIGNIQLLTSPSEELYSAAVARREALIYQMHLVYGISTDDLGKYIEESDFYTSVYALTYEELEEAYGKAVRDLVEKTMANFDPE